MFCYKYHILLREIISIFSFKTLPCLRARSTNVVSVDSTLEMIGDFDEKDDADVLKMIKLKV